MVVNGHVLTRSMVEQRASMMVALRRHRSSGLPEARLRSFYRAYTNGYPHVYVRQCVISDFARTNGIVVTEKLLNRYRQRAFRAQKGRNDKVFEDLKRVPGVIPSLFEEQIRAEALNEAVLDFLKQAYPTNFGPEYVAREIALMQDYNNRMALTNDLIFARATNVWEKLKSGVDFVKAADQFTEIEDDKGGNCEWGLFAPEELRADDPSVYECVSKMAVGEFTPPVLGDNGLMIVKLTDRGEDGAVSLSRIFFRLPLMIDICPPEEIAKTAYDDHYRSLFESTVSNLIDAASVEFANKGE